MNINQRRADRLIIILAVVCLTLWGAAVAAFGQDTTEPLAIYTGSTTADAPAEQPDFGYSINTMVRSDERGVADASLITKYWTLAIGGDGDFGDHDTMGVFGSMAVRVDDVALSFLSSLDWADGELGNWTPGGRLSWWPQSFACIWTEFADGTLRFGVDARGESDWFRIGGSAWIATDKGTAADLWIGAQLDGLLLRIGGLGIDDTAPAWWARGPATDRFSLSAYLSIGWRG